jgi:hypothetical protein
MVQAPGRKSHSGYSAFPAVQSTARSCHPYHPTKEKALATMSPVSSKNGRSMDSYSVAAARVISQIAVVTKIPDTTLAETVGVGRGIAGLGWPRSRIANAAAMLMQRPDHASAPSASDGRCQPTNKTPVVNIELM